MKFQKNKDDYIEVKYEGVWYFLDGKDWVMDLKIDNSKYYSISQTKTVQKFIIPINNLTRKQAEKQIKELMLKYTKNIEWKNNNIQTKLTRLLRKAKLDQIKIENVEVL